MNRLNCAASVALAALALGACASEPLVGSGPLRVMVRLAQPGADAAAIAASAEAVAGKPVRYVAASSEQWHALTIDCRDAADCRAAFDRLKADTLRFADVQVDGRKRIVAPQY